MEQFDIANIIFIFRLRLALCKFIFECKIDFEENILRKRKTCFVVWLCCENYAGKLFLVFGLTCKKPIFRKGKHKSAPSHRLVQPRPLLRKSTTHHQPSKIQIEKRKKTTPLLRYHQNTTTITTKSAIKEKEYQTQKYVGGLVRVREKKWDEKMKIAVEKRGRVRLIEERDGETVPDWAMAVVD